LRWLVPFRAAIISFTSLALAIPALAGTAETAVLRPTTAPANIVIGFVGGFVGHDNPRHGPVQEARRIQQTFPRDTFVQVFENRHRKNAYKAVLRLLDTNHDGFLSAEEKARARIVLFGHSWGAAAAVMLARDLRRQGVPVLLTVQVDSVAKAWQNDSVIPDNVSEAVNFYQPHGILHGRAQITAADPAKTQILGNYLTDYKKQPVPCPQASWLHHVFTAGHMQIECDPTMWSRIEDMVKQRLSLAEASAASASAAVPAQP
jgi:pimeloyl-ACP methyl ester carboxylesterase